jgi:cytochrome c oxidase subunit II
VTDTRSEFDDLLRTYLPVLIAVFVIIAVLTAYIVISAVLRKTGGQGRESRSWLELGYAALLAGVAATLVTFSLRAEARVDDVSDDPALTIDVTAFQWQWRFVYPGTGVALAGSRERPATLTVPVGRTILFELTARDVVHSFWVPELRFKRDAFPKRTTRFDLVFPHEGTYAGRCAEFCGLRHADMTFEVEALSPAEFESWLESRRSSG